MFTLVDDAELRGVQRGALGVAVVAGVAVGVGVLVARQQFLRSYLVAWVFWGEIALGSLALSMIHHVTGGRWGVVIRRVLEAATLTLPVLAGLFVPIALGVRELYPWADPAHVAHDPLLQAKAAYLNVPFFLVRTAGYFAIWIVVARAMARWSLAQDVTDDPGPARRLQLMSRGGLLLMGLTMTFAAVDWMMSLEPHWASTIYGVMFMGGSVLTTFAFVIPTLAWLAGRPAVARLATPLVFHDLGKLMLAFVMLWAYFALSQFLITWSANLPEEIPWYLARGGGWQSVAVLVVLFHFVLPFVVLLSRDAKRRPRTLAAVAAMLGVMRFVDLVWLIAPAFHPATLAVHWLDAATVLAVGGVWLAAFVGHLAARPLVPVRDPSLAEAA